MTIACTFAFDFERYPDAEDAAYVLNEFFERAVEICDDSALKVWFEQSELEQINEKREALGEAGINLIRQEEIKDQNWNTSCPELFAELPLGKLRICPVSSPDEALGAPAPDEIRVIPGTGFGTGHHATTKNLILMLQEIAEQNQQQGQIIPIEKILDLGTGSGLLAIVAEKLFQTEIDAIDIDELALQNAIDNLEINLCERVKLMQGSIDAASGPYQLIIANLYAELLAEFADQLRSLLTPGGIILLSGIMDERLPLIKSAFPEELWQTITEVQEGQWLAIKLIGKK
jgi:ribosomal protein L11 methyltransferase